MIPKGGLLMEIIIALLAIALFAALAPLSASRKRAFTQKILTGRLVSEQFSTSVVLPAGELSLYIDDIHQKWFFRMSRTDTNPVIYPFSSVSLFELFDSGEKIAFASPGHPLSGPLFDKGRRGELLKNDDCASLLLLVIPKGDKNLTIKVPFTASAVSRHSRVFKTALSEARGIISALDAMRKAPQAESLDAQKE